MEKTIMQYTVVVPVFNEEAVILESYKRLKSVMDSLNETYDILFVNDGSTDKTAEIAGSICAADKNIKLLSFSRNFGHQPAISAGMDYSDGKAVIVIDADLQDPPEVIPKMIEKWKSGYDVVYGKRVKREGESTFKKFTAKTFYRFLDGITDIQIPVDAGDFRLIDRRVCNVLCSLPEHNRYVRGLVSWLGFKQTGVEFVRQERFAGVTKYPLKKMIKFSQDAITALSYKPLKAPACFGVVMFALSFTCFLASIVLKCSGVPLSDWALGTSLIVMFMSLQFIILGVFGEYIGRVCDEVRGRPLYIISEKKGL